VVEEGLAIKLLRYEQETNNYLRDLTLDIQNHSGRMDEFEARTLDSMQFQESKRDEHNNRLELKMNELSDWFYNHNKSEMEKYDLIIAELKNLSDSYTVVKLETDDNSSLLRQKRIEEEKDRAVKEAIDNINKPYREIKTNAILAAVTVITGAIVVGIWNLVIYVSSIDNLVKGAM